MRLYSIHRGGVTGRTGRLLAVIILAGAAVFSGCRQKEAPSAAEYIGIDGAKAAALKAAGSSGEEAVFQAAGLDNKNGIFFYQVIFQQNGMEHEYDIDALTGAVIEERHSPISGEAAAEETGKEEAAPGAEKEAGNEGKASGTAKEAGKEAEASGTEGVSQREEQGLAEPVTQAGNVPEDPGQIDAKTALSIALSHAGLTEEEIASSQIHGDRENGKQVFEVEFVSADGTEYDYELSAEDGTVLSFDYDAESHFRGVPLADSGIITEEEARQKVLDRVPGAPADSVRLKLKEDDGRLEYEGELIFEHMEYEFKIDAYSGGLIEWEAERLTGR